MKYRKIDYSIFPKFFVEFLNYRLYAENLSHFTVYTEAQRMKCFFKYVLCVKDYQDLNLFFSITDVSNCTLEQLETFSMSDMLSYIGFLSNTLNLGDQTKSGYVATVKRFYYYMYKKLNYFNVYHFEDLAIPKYRPKSVVYIPVEDCKKFLTVVDNSQNLRDIAIIKLILNTGARRCEVANALLTDLDLHNKTLLVVGKGNKERYLYLNDTVINSLKLYLSTRQDSCEYLFTTCHCGKLDYNDVYRIVRKYLELAELDIKKYSTHKLRHSFATFLYQNNIDLRAIQELLGHENLNTTKRYVHLTDDTLHNIVDNFIFNDTE